MKWETFYDNYCEYDEKKMINCINRLADMGSAEEIIDVVIFSGYENANKILIERALQKGIRFSHDELSELDGNFDNDFFMKIVHTNIKNCNQLTPSVILEHAEWLDEKTLEGLAFYCKLPFSEEQLNELASYLEPAIIQKLYEKSGVEYYDSDDFSNGKPEDDDEIELEKMSLLEKAFVFRTINKLSKMLKL